MEKFIKKADVLIEAIPYIKAFRDRIFVIKIGGENIEKKSVFDSFLLDVAFLNFVGIKVVLIHGGGQFISKRMRLSGIKPKFIGGLRITCKDTIVIVEEALYKLNQVIVKKFRGLGVNSIGLTPREDTAVFARKKPSGLDLGFVGEVSRIDTKRLFCLLKNGCVLVVSPVGLGANSMFYNINADLVASCIASELTAEKLILMTNVDGILSGTKRNRLLPTVTEKMARRLIKNKTVDGGMIPKVEAALNALKAGVKKVHIINAQLKHALLLEIFTNKGIGTELIRI